MSKLMKIQNLKNMEMSRKNQIILNSFINKLL